MELPLLKELEKLIKLLELKSELILELMHKLVFKAVNLFQLRKDMEHPLLKESAIQIKL